MDKVEMKQKDFDWWGVTFPDVFSCFRWEMHSDTGERIEMSRGVSYVLPSCLLLRYYKAMGKGEDPFCASSILGSGSLSLTMSFKASEDNLKNMRQFANQEKRNYMYQYNGLKCRCHYVQCLMLNEYSEQLRLQSSFYVPALFANSHGCMLSCADT